MLMAHDDVNFWSNEDFTMVDDDRLSIDLDILYSILTEDPDQFHHQKNPEGDFTYDVGDHHNSEVKKGFQEFKGTPSLGAESSGPFPSFSRHTEASISRTGGSKVLSECSGNVGCNKQFSAPNSSPVRSCSKGLKNLTTLVSGNDFCKETDRVSRDALPPYRVDSVEMLHEPKCDTAFSSAAASDNYILGYPFDMCIQQLEEGTGFQMNVGGDMDNRDNSQSETMEKIDLNLEDYGFFTEDSMQTLAAPEKDPCVLVGIPPHSATYTDYNTCQVSDMTFETSEPYSFSQNQVTTKSTVIFPDSLRKPFSDRSKFHFMPSIEKTTSDIKDEKEEVTDENAFLSSKTAEDQVGHANDDGQYNLTSAGNSFSDISNRFYVDAPSTQPMVGTVPYIPSLKKKLTDYGHLVPCQLSSIKRHMAQKKVEKQGVPAPEMAFSPQPQVICDGVTSLTHDVCLGGHALEHSALCNNQLDAMDGKDTKLFQPRSAGSFSSDVNPESVQSNFSNHKYHCSDDNDVCILEDMSMPSSSSPSLIHEKLTMSSERSISSDSLLYLGSEGVKFKENDERFIFRAVLQDLSQPKSEVSLPHGVLAVPLLRHQRIALSWMVQKETASIHCSGGILADDQGLGKTISTIALILKERSPSSKANQMDMELGIHETLNLDDDDSGSEMSEVGGMKSRHVPVQPKGRPAAGTLVVCPTSVLRQWAEELHNKVTRKANLSVLVYHGSSRTKDPCELAKYDVVLTTYSIVSMEVPKQPLADEECDENEKHKAHDQPVGLCSSKKRKHPLSSAKRSLTTKKEIECASLEPVARPLARVGWFRVVLDEAQSIKNHRTQVARACWGLRAKRRWCLSGTPIQNTVDDLYSYFRFLRYEPYAAFKSFCYTIKNPISRNPAGGYRKLQAVLKTIMLRRTKGTLLDGEPIVTLPPKSVKLKKVNFSKEERDFYMRLEADSRAQFEVYAAEGTVKQNYVNILLMLLRLRQACDHPLLVRGYDSNSVWRSSVETAKKLPRDKKFFLLNCLEASLALCGICNDPPEDAVVSLCGHVFCNQCICEHLTGDDSKCAVTSCKVQLNILSVFSKGTLNNALSDQSVHDTSDSPGSEVVDPHPVGQSCGSSKIRAAIEVLQLLSKPKEFITRHGSPPISHRREVANDMPSKRSSSEERRSSDLFRVTGEKAIVFSQWTRMLDLLEASLRNSSIQFRRLDGTMTVAARDKAVRDFNTRPEVSVMIMSLKAASLGLNMVAACHVLLLDLWWNPTTEDQAIDRAHRIGQTRPVTVLRLTVKDTVEDRILALQQKKREMVASAFGEDDETGSRQTRLTVEDLKYLFMV